MRRMIEFINRAEIGQALDLAAEDVVLDWSNSIGPFKGVYPGRAGITEWFSSFIEAWEEFSWTPQEFIELDDDRMIVVNRLRMRGKGSGVDVEATGAQLWTFRDGKPIRIKVFQSRSDALEAAGQAPSG